ncbi:polysaccharide deacetylase family protein [Phenylobacterium montanum]|uniref:Chitooligosaccharide deacetylase n=1 Tax=Phenylobacterium montanum TaxID=2823693 RepID=A0A975ISP9_9CAUL|nr:polysaccharide deacetylase family protein [Caulobacter sp. S6]QUD85968.1 polysaccharide deacetylase family protein [Caulobacter sp. S6]
MRRSTAFLAALIPICLLAWGPQARAGGGRVALTFDDLPALSLFNDQPYVNYLNEMLLRGLKRRRLPATGFVNESKLDQIDRAQQIANLEKWLDAGMTLGNHTFSHESPDQLGGAGYIQDIARGEPVTRGLLEKRGRSLGWFRHPYLETGVPEAVKKEIDDWLAAHGYRIAPVTIDADDWEFAEPYDDAIARHDEARRLRIKRQYLEYTERTVGWYQAASTALFGRQIAFVMLLHATRLNADCIDDLADILKRRKLKGVTLDEAMKDPAYRTRDPYVGHDGIDWMERWSNELHKDLPWDSWQDPPRQIVEEYDRTNNDRH